MTAPQIGLPRRLAVGGGALADSGRLVRELGFSRPVVVTDAFLSAQGTVARLVAALTDAGCEVSVFDGTVPDPTTDSLGPGLGVVREHRADCVIGLGGGSPLDTAKALAVLAEGGGTMRDYKAPTVTVGPALPVIAVPTTAGSGSEATQFSIITDSASDEKMLCPGPAFLPVAAIVDYELTLSMPARLTADTGVDALTHAIEAYVSRKANPFADGFALTAISTIAANIRAVYADGADRPAREAMMLAATQAGVAFSNSSVALVHGMSRPIGAHFHVAHGLSNAMLLPAVMRFSVGAAPSRYADCARAYGLSGDSDEALARSLVVAIEQLCADLAVPTPRAYGIDRTRWDELAPLMAEQALASGSPGNNPRVPDASEIVALYDEVYG
ncbi:MULTISPECIES: iron-containing alcohol dehydrogenase [Tsukamurella]|uniref:Iron-containing alcohol dehydrogenase n=2 Tax=Tsukamurella TaxID=2060 RepID=A0A5C5S0X4_9ACTN|nr:MULTISPECIES: iron-containing alcohol dehydrogenase [Tsukamurella]NMD54151.1 iron-containing alcohol dehydrogenase [Tsukamurella columbiensis]TWS28318.1 iron-containing alcohol dehydrogenase [Tsukamurella conjunctivitidis]